MYKAIILLALLIGYTAQAEAKSYTCSNVGGTPEWTISIDLTSKEAGFFDNDSWVTVPLVRAGQLESLPPQPFYVFEGRDPHGGRGATLTISFNEYEKSASVTFQTPGRNPEIKQAEDGCVLDR